LITSFFDWASLKEFGRYSRTRLKNRAWPSQQIDGASTVAGSEAVQRIRKWLPFVGQLAAAGKRASKKSSTARLRSKAD
jgi:hypothetical protein